MILPRNDLLEYCARRYAATAVRRYVLLDDPALISATQREQFKRFALNATELTQLSDDAKARRIDENFGNKIRPARQPAGHRGRDLGAHGKLPELARAKFQAAIDKIQTELRDQTAGVREISADRILDGSWTPAASLNALQRQVAEGREKIEQGRLSSSSTGSRRATGGRSSWPRPGPTRPPSSTSTSSASRADGLPRGQRRPARAPAIDELRGQVQRLQARERAGQRRPVPRRDEHRRRPRSSAPTAAGTSWSPARTRTSRPPVIARSRCSTTTSTRSGRG